MKYGLVNLELFPKYVKPSTSTLVHAFRREAFPMLVLGEARWVFTCDVTCRLHVESLLRMPQTNSTVSNQFKLCVTFRQHEAVADLVDDDIHMLLVVCH